MSRTVLENRFFLIDASSSRGSARQTGVHCEIHVFWVNKLVSLGEVMSTVCFRGLDMFEQVLVRQSLTLDVVLMDAVDHGERSPVVLFRQASSPVQRMM